MEVICILIVFLLMVVYIATKKFVIAISNIKVIITRVSFNPIQIIKKPFVNSKYSRSIIIHKILV